VPSLLVPSLPSMGVHVMAEGTVVSHGPVPCICNLCGAVQVRVVRGDGSHQLLVGRHLGSCWAISIEVIGYRCNPWRWYRGEEGEYINRGRAGEQRVGKEMDGCPLTLAR
jgi:hypothetical protein